MQKAVEFAEISCSSFISIKADMDSGDAFNELYDSCVKTCSANNIEVPSGDSRNAKRTRISSQTFSIRKTVLKPSTIKFLIIL